MIKVEQLHYAYKQDNDGKNVAIDDVTFHIAKGEWVAIVGHNGSGKSTLAKLLDGLLVADAGKIIIDDIPLSLETIWQVRSKLGMVFQNPENQFVGATVADDVAFGLENNGVTRQDMVKRIDGALDAVGMLTFKDKEPSRLSGGQKQRVAIAGVLALQSDIIILDEATAMLDPKGRRQVIETVQRLQKVLGLTVISITHDIEEALLADRVFVMHQGKLLYQEKPKDLFDKIEDVSLLGLELPVSYQIKEALKQQNICVPDTYMTLEELEDWLCQYLLNK